MEELKNIEKLTKFELEILIEKYKMEELKNIEKLTKFELKNLIEKYKNEIINIDNFDKSIFFYIFSKDETKKNLLSKLIDYIKLEIIYKIDNEKNINSKRIQNRDPLKYSKKKRKYLIYKN